MSVVVSISFLGLWTDDLPAMRRLYAEAYGLAVIHETPSCVWFALGDRAELHLYARSDRYHSSLGGYRRVRGSAITQMDWLGVP